MSIKYTRNEVLDRLNQYTGGLEGLYNTPEVNWMGRTPAKDTKELYSEIVCEWLLRPENMNRLQSMKTITRSNSYAMHTHDASSLQHNSNRQEEKIAMMIFNQGFLPNIGWILDYQTPLKDVRTDPAGKIDLLAYDPFDNVLRVLELKKPGNHTDTLLRCSLEAYTYSQIIDRKKLIADFNKHIQSNPVMQKRLGMMPLIPQNAALVPSPMIFRDSLAFQEWQEVKEGKRPQLDALLRKLGVIVTVIEKQFVRVF